MALHPDGTVWATGAGKEARQLVPGNGRVQVLRGAGRQDTSSIPGAYGIAVAGDGSVWFAEDEVDLMARVDPETGKVDEFKIPYNEATPSRAA